MRFWKQHGLVSFWLGATTAVWFVVASLSKGIPVIIFYSIMGCLSALFMGEWLFTKS